MKRLWANVQISILKFLLKRLGEVVEEDFFVLLDQRNRLLDEIDQLGLIIRQRIPWEVPLKPERKSRRRVLGKSGFVYIIADRSANRIKIGYSADPQSRLRGLQTASHSQLELLSLMPGTQQDESEMHDRFADYRVNGEWFDLTGDLAAYVSQLA